MSGPDKRAPSLNGDGDDWTAGYGFGVDRFGWTDDALAELLALRGWTEGAIERLELRYDPATGTVGLPIRDATLDDLGTVRYLPNPIQRNGRRKMTQPAGVPRQLFPPPESIADGPRRVLLVEGEPDAVTAWSAGLEAVAVPGVATWHPDNAARFAGRHWTVHVVFDCDEGGRAAAAAIVAELAGAGVDARLVDLDPTRDDGYDLTDYLLGYGPEALHAELERAQPWTPPQPAAAAIIEPLRTFLERELPPAESLVGVTRGGTNLLPRYGWVMPWGREGSGKTSVLVDLLFHIAAGLPWLHYPVARPMRAVVVINEGIPGGLQDKLRQKLELWDGDRDAVLDNLAIYASPWGAFTFRNSAIVEHARAFARDFAADYVALDPLHTLGTSGAGSPQETEAFKTELRAFGLWDDLGIITAHHANKSGMVSGDWARHPDTVIHLEKDGKNPATKITLEKARPADPAELGVPAILEWVVDTMGYRRLALPAEGPIVTDAELLDRIVEHLAAAPEPVYLTALSRQVKGEETRIVDVAKAAVTRGELLNVSTHAQRFALRLPRTTPNDTERHEQTRIDTDNDGTSFGAGTTPNDRPLEPASPRGVSFGVGPPLSIERGNDDTDRGTTPPTEEDEWHNQF